VVTSVRVTVSGMRAAICWTWPAVAKGPRLPWAGAQAESSGRVEEHEVLVDGLAQQLAEQGDDVPHAGVGQVGGQLTGEGF
jgi:hypothetical protein